MKKILLILSIIVTVAALVSCNNNGDQPELSTTTTTTTEQKQQGGITLDSESLIIGIGEAKKLTVFNIATNSETLNVLWESSDPTVAVVDINGNVTGVNDGTAQITAKTIDGQYQAVCSVTVSSVVSGVILDKETLALEVGDNFGLNATVLPEGVNNNGVTWFSSVESVATVSDKGIVTAVGNGVTSIGVKTVDGEFSAFCTVTVTTAVKGINLQEVSIKLNKGVTTTIYYTISPMDASDKAVSWSTSDPNVATVTNGKVTAVGAGVATITVTSTNGCSSSCIVTVSSAVTGVTVNHSVLTLNVGMGEQLVAFISPSDADITDVRWSSSNSAVASVGALTGVVTANASGTATITVTTVDGDFTASCEVTVIKPITTLTFANDSYAINKGQTLSLIPSRIPADADPEVLTYECSDTTIATIDENGLLTGVGHGIVTVTVTSKYGVSASCTVNVTDPEMIRVPVESITVNQTQITIPEGAKFKLEVTIIPENATDKNITYTVHSSGIVMITNGEIIAISAGTTMISVKVDGKSKNVLVVVEKLSQEEIDRNIEAYNQAVKAENDRHEKVLATLKAEYDKECEFFNKALAGVSISKDEYDTRKADIQAQIRTLQDLMEEARLNNNQQLVAECKQQIDDLNGELDVLEGNYSIRLEIEANLAQIQSEYNSQLSIENNLYNSNMAVIEYDYQFVQKYIQEKEDNENSGTEDPEGGDDPSGDNGEDVTDGTGSENGAENNGTESDGADEGDLL